MCRFLGVVANERAPISKLLGNDLDPFLRLAYEHKHGWGVAHRAQDGTIRSVKAPQSAEHSAELRAWLDTCVTDMAVVHLRMAGTDLAVSPGNTHPFGDTRAAFVHNGDFHPRYCLDASIDPGLLAAAEGQTDSERYYLAVRTRMNHGIPADRALEQAADEIRLVADSYASLNCLLLTPKRLLAYSGHDPASEVIGRRGEKYFSLYQRVLPGRAVVASQGWQHHPLSWRELPENRVVQFVPGSQGAVTHRA